MVRVVAHVVAGGGPGGSVGDVPVLHRAVAGFGLSLPAMCCSTWGGASSVVSPVPPFLTRGMLVGRSNE